MAAQIGLIYFNIHYLNYSMHRNKSSSFCNGTKYSLEIKADYNTKKMNRNNKIWNTFLFCIIFILFILSVCRLLVIYTLLYVVRFCTKAFCSMWINFLISSSAYYGAISCKSTVCIVNCLWKFVLWLYIEFCYTYVYQYYQVKST